MSLRLLFWVIMLLWLIFGIIVPAWSNWHAYAVWGGGLLQFILFFILGWRVFGAPVRDDV